MENSKIACIFQRLNTVASGIADMVGDFGKKVSQGVDTVTEWFNSFETQADNEKYDETIENLCTVVLIKEGFDNQNIDVDLIDKYLRDCLKMKPNHDSRQALWNEVGRATRWLEVEYESVTNYLFVSVRKEAGRIKRDREKSDRLWGKFDVILSNNPESIMLNNNRFLSPEDAVLRAEDCESRYEIIRKVAENGTVQEKRLINLLLAGYSPAECIKATGGKWSHYQALQRKLNRSLKKYFSKECLVN